jgi:hypothetical protein
VPRRRRPTDEEILAAIVELADDGFAERRELALALPGFGERDLMKSIGRAVRRNLILERRGPDSKTYLALTPEGWNVHRGDALSERHLDKPKGQVEAEARIQGPGR